MISCVWNLLLHLYYVYAALFRPKFYLFLFCVWWRGGGRGRNNNVQSGTKGEGHQGVKQIKQSLYTITRLLCAFSLVVDHDLLKNTNRQTASNPRQITSADVTCFFVFFSCPENPSISHLNFYCIKQK